MPAYANEFSTQFPNRKQRAGAASADERIVVLHILSMLSLRLCYALPGKKYHLFVVLASEIFRSFYSISAL